MWTPRVRTPIKREVINAFVALDNFVCDAGEGAGDAVRVHDDGGLGLRHV